MKTRIQIKPAACQRVKSDLTSMDKTVSQWATLYIYAGNINKETILENNLAYANKFEHMQRL